MSGRDIWPRSLHSVTFFESATRFGGLFGGGLPFSKAR
jgi:hypothetical protein